MKTNDTKKREKAFYKKLSLNKETEKQT